MIIAVSDMHLGAQNANKPAFENFLDFLIENKDELKHLVLCGDFLDMWRRDLAGIVLASSDIINQLRKLQNRGVTVHIVAGNHDYHFIKLTWTGYDFCFYREEDNWRVGHSPHSVGMGNKCMNELVLDSDGKKFRFVHGDQFELLQVVGRGLFEPLSHTGDAGGMVVSGIWGFLTGGWRFWRKKDADNKSWTKGSLSESLSILDEDPLHPMRKFKHKLFEKDAINYQKLHGEFLIFGHSHYPFVDEGCKIANCGTWVQYPANQNRIVNTFIEIQNGNAQLYVFKNKTVTPKPIAPRTTQCK